MYEYRSCPATRAVAFLVVTLFGGCRLAAQDTPPPPPAQEQPEVFSRGPVHEAFAEPVDIQLQAGLVAPGQPPPGIEEVPPAERPEGAQFVWIPGYWSWDADRNGYIWVSGCWRAAPPRMSWVPGYWSQVSGGWEWISGFWAPAGVTEIEYLPAPPAAGDMEPLGPAPSPDTIWVPPCMYWVQGQYVRRAGYWLQARPDWVWVPSHYVMTPRGYVFAEGHWDYSLERRGVLFAPIGFPVSIYGRSGITYSPSIVIDIGLLRVSLFAYPRYCHYFFGDYYDDTYLRIGIFPWFESQRLHTWYDPLYEHDRWRNRQTEPRWEERERDVYNRRRADRSLRPARTYREQEARLAKVPEPQRRVLRVAQPMNVVVTSRDTPLRFERIDSDVRQRVFRQATAVDTFRDERNRWESAGGRSKTVPVPREHMPIVTPPPVRREAVESPRQRRPTETSPAERRETAQPPTERREVTAPPVRQETVESPRQRRPSETSPAERRETAQPSTERREVTAPQRRETVQGSQERKEAATPPASRGPAFVPPRAANVTRSERVQIPAPPVVGGSGRPGIFRRGPPSQPADEDKDKDGRDIRRSNDADRRHDD